MRASMRSLSPDEGTNPLLPALVMRPDVKLAPALCALMLSTPLLTATLLASYVSSSMFPHPAGEMLIRPGTTCMSVHTWRSGVCYVSDGDVRSIRSYYISSSHTRLIRCLTLTGLSQTHIDDSFGIWQYHIYHPAT